MKRVDEKEAGAEPAAAPRREISAVAEVADPPGAARARGVDLGHEPPLPIADDPLGVEPARGHDEGGRGASLRRLGDHRMPAERKVAGNREARLAGEHAIDEHRVDPPVHLVELASGSVLQFNASDHLLAVRHVHRQAAVLALAADERRRQGAPPIAQRRALKLGTDLVLAPARNTQCRQHRAYGRRTHRNEAAGLIPVLRRDPVSAGKAGQGLADRLERPAVRAAHRVSRDCVDARMRRA